MTAFYGLCKAWEGGEPTASGLGHFISLFNLFFLFQERELHWMLKVFFFGTSTMEEVKSDQKVEKSRAVGRLLLLRPNGPCLHVARLHQRTPLYNLGRAYTEPTDCGGCF